MSSPMVIKRQLSPLSLDGDNILFIQHFFNENNKSNLLFYINYNIILY